MGSKGELVATDFLFVEPGPLLGLARFFDVAGVPEFYNRSASEGQADANAMFADWFITGQDLCAGVSIAKGEDHRKTRPR